MSYVAAGYSAAFVVLSGYAFWLLRKRRSLAKLVGPDRRP